MNWKERITIDPDVLVGKPVIKGTRLAVEFIVELLAEGWTHRQLQPGAMPPAIRCVSLSGLGNLA